MSWSKDKKLVLLAVTGLLVAQLPAFATSPVTKPISVSAEGANTAVQTSASTQSKGESWESLTTQAEKKASDGETSDAEKLFNQAYSLAKTFAATDQRKIKATENLAEVIENQGRYGDALKLYQTASELRKSIYGERSDRLSKSFYNIGRVQMLAGDYEKARTSLKKALDLRQFSSSEEANQQDLALVHILYNLGVLETATGNFQKAEEHLNRSQSIAQHLAKHKENAEIFSKLALLSLAEGDLPKAENQADTSLSMAEKFGKGDKVLKAEALDSVAMVQLARGNFKKASDASNQAWTLKHEALGFHHPLTADSLLTAGLIKIAERKYDAAEMKFDDAIAVFNHASDSNKPGNSRALMGRAVAHLKQKDKAAAAEDFEQALTLMNSSTGIDSRLSAKYTALYKAQQGNFNALEIIEKLKAPKAAATDKLDLFGELLTIAVDDGHSDELVAGIKYKDLLPVLGVGFVVIVLLAMALLMPDTFSRLFPWGREDHATTRNKNRAKKGSTQNSGEYPQVQTQEPTEFRAATETERRQVQVWKDQVKNIKNSGQYDRLDFRPSSQSGNSAFKQDLSTPVQPEGSNDQYW